MLIHQRLLAVLMMLATPLAAQNAGTLSRPPTRVQATQQRTVPNVVGRPLDQARGMLAQYGVEVARVSEAASSSVAPGTVMRQSPSAGTVIQPGMTAQLVVAAAAPTEPTPAPPTQPELVGVPSVIGQPVAVARGYLALRGFPSQVVDSAEASAPAGTVLLQDPAAGSRVPRRTPVRLVLARAPAAVEVPSVVGMDRAGAERTLRRAGFRLGRVSEAEATGEPGRILEQSPEAGFRARPGTPVAVTVALAQLATVPDLRGFTVDRARQALETSGLRVGEVTEREAAGLGTAVLEQSQQPGARVPQETPVDLVVSRPPPIVVQPRDSTVEVPNVTGMALRAARSRLRRAGLEVSVPQDSLAWSVTSQAPAAGTRVRPGVIVTLALREPVRPTPPRPDSLVVVAPPDSTPVVAVVDSPARVVTAVDTVDSAAMPVVAPVDPSPAASQPISPPPPEPGWSPDRSQVMMIGGLLLALAALAVVVGRWLRPKPPVAAEAAGVGPMPSFGTRGGWEPGEHRVDVAGKLVSGPELSVRGFPGAVATEVRASGPLVSNREG